MPVFRSRAERNFNYIRYLTKICQHIQILIKLGQPEETYSHRWAREWVGNPRTGNPLPLWKALRYGTAVVSVFSNKLGSVRAGDGLAFFRVKFLACVGNSITSGRFFALLFVERGRRPTSSATFSGRQTDRSFNLAPRMILHFSATSFVWPGETEHVWRPFLFCGLGFMPVRSTKGASISRALDTTWSTFLLQKLIVTQLVKKSPSSYITRRLITMFTKAHRCIKLWSKSTLFRLL